MNLYVMTADAHVFHAFLHEYRLREHHGSGNNREGQVRRLSHRDQLRGCGPCLVMVWGPLLSRAQNDILDEIQADPRNVVVRVPISQCEQDARSRNVRDQL